MLLGQAWAQHTRAPPPDYFSMKVTFALQGKHGQEAPSTVVDKKSTGSTTMLLPLIIPRNHLADSLRNVDEKHGSSTIVLRQCRYQNQPFYLQMSRVSLSSFFFRGLSSPPGGL